MVFIKGILLFGHNEKTVRYGQLKYHAHLYKKITVYPILQKRLSNEMAITNMMIWPVIKGMLQCLFFQKKLDFHAITSLDYSPLYCQVSPLQPRFSVQFQDFLVL